jgi:NAD(P)-dependent dehydrogenase (short-subunit alcohol dehydrogenase family)
MRLANKVAIVTGAGQGIGLSIAELFAREGAALVLAERNPRTGQAAVETASRLGAKATLVASDVSVPATAQRLVRVARKKFGRVDILVNNAGIAGSAYGDGPVTESREEAWDRILRVNLKSVFLCCRYAIPEMIRAGGGSVINMASILALVGCSEHYTSHAYVASKGGIVSLTRAMAAYYARKRVRVNALCPGATKTPMTEGAEGNPKLLRYIMGKQPLAGGLGSAQDVAAAALFLASDESRLITVVILPVDAGWSTGL